MRGRVQCGRSVEFSQGGRLGLVRVVKFSWTLGAWSAVAVLPMGPASCIAYVRIHCLGPVLSATGQLARQRASRQADKRSMMRPTEVANVDSKVANGVHHWQWPSLADEIISESAILEGYEITVVC